MDIVAVASDGTPNRDQSSTIGEDVLRSVETHVKREGVAPKIAYGAIFALPTLLTFLSDGLSFETLVTAVITFFGARLALFLTRKIYLEPSRDRSFDRAAKKLKTSIETAYGPGVQTYSWSLYAPGALGLTPTGHVIVTANSTNYRMLALSPSQIADVRVERRAEVITQTRHSGSTGVGFVGKSFAVGQSFGSRSTSISQTIEYYALELRYQLERNGKIYTLIVPGGSSRTTVEEICTAIRRMEA